MFEGLNRDETLKSQIFLEHSSVRKSLISSKLIVSEMQIISLPSCLVKLFLNKMIWPRNLPGIDSLVVYLRAFISCRLK
jgi:hypothetical protein